MNLRKAFLIAAGILVPALASAGPGRTVEECVEIAVRDSGQVAEAEGKVAEWRGRLAEVESIFYPKIIAFAFAAPTYGIQGSALDPDEKAKRDYDRWGPLLHFEGLLAQPIYTFGQAAAGKRAAKERLAVEKARLDQARNAVALEVYRYYFLHLYVKGLQPTLAFARKILDEAESTAKELYDQASGKVTNVDLMKLRYASTELEKYRVQAEIGLPLSLAALKHTMGLPESEPLELADSALPGLPGEEPPSMGELVRVAWEKRPEVSQLKHGREAALSLEQAERLAFWPVVLAAGQLTVGWSPVRTDQKNPFLFDPWNDVSGGVALALKWDFDPAKVKARGDTAHAMVEQVDGLAKFASTGIAVEVRKARDDFLQARRMAALSDEGSVAARKWMVFAGTAYASGTGETRDVLEGVATFVGARRNYFDGLLAAHMARAQLAWATGDLVRAPQISKSPGG
jgi:outer membrane protein TolC